MSALYAANHGYVTFIFPLMLNILTSFMSYYVQSTWMISLTAAPLDITVLFLYQLVILATISHVFGIKYYFDIFIES